MDIVSTAITDLDRLQKAMSIPILFQMYASVVVGKAFLYTEFLGGFYAGINLSAVLFEKAFISVEYNVPARIQIGFGWRLF